MKKLLFIRRPELLIEEVRTLLLPLFPYLEQVIVFGSVARGTMDVNSDLDIFIVGEPSSFKKQVIEKMENLTMRTGVFFNLIFLSKEECSVYSSLYQTALQEGQIIWQKKNIDIALRHLSRGENTLDAATHLLQKKFFSDALSRAYYAAYHAAMAMLLSVGSNPRTHKGVINQFYILFVEPGYVPKELGRKFARLLNDCMEVDYGIIPLISGEDAAEGIETTSELLKISKEWIVSY